MHRSALLSLGRMPLLFFTRPIFPVAAPAAAPSSGLAAVLPPFVVRRPDEIVVESWVGVPLRSVPETDEWTFTRSVRDFCRRFVPAREGE